MKYADSFEETDVDSCQMQNVAVSGGPAPRGLLPGLVAADEELCMPLTGRDDRGDQLGHGGADGDEGEGDESTGEVERIGHPHRAFDDEP